MAREFRSRIGQVSDNVYGWVVQSRWPQADDAPGIGWTTERRAFAGGITYEPGTGDRVVHPEEAEPMARAAVADLVERLRREHAAEWEMM